MVIMKRLLFLLFLLGLILVSCDTKDSSYPDLDSHTSETEKISESESQELTSESFEETESNGYNKPSIVLPDDILGE